MEFGSLTEIRELASKNRFNVFRISSEEIALPTGNIDLNEMWGLRGRIVVYHVEQRKQTIACLGLSDGPKPCQCCIDELWHRCTGFRTHQ